MHSRTLFVLLFLSICSIVYSEIPVASKVSISLDEITQLTDNWFFTPNDDMRFTDRILDEYEWYDDDPSDIWKNNVREASDYEGIGWYLFPFQINLGTIPDKIGISLPLSFSGYQLYINGQLIYESDSFLKDKLYGAIPIVLEIPNELLTSENLISVRVKSIMGIGGFGSNGIKPFIKIGSYKRVFLSWIRPIIQYSAFAFVSIFLFVFFLFRFFLRKENRYNLYFSLFSISVGVFIMGYYGYWYFIFDGAWAYWLLTFISGIFMYLTPILFIHSFFTIKRNILSLILNWFYLALSIVLTIEFIITREIYYYIKYIYNFFNLTYIVLVIYLVVLGISAIRKKLEYSRIMFIGISLLGISFIYSMLTFVGIIHYTPLIGEGFFLMVLTFSFVLAKRFAQTHTNLETAHGQLIFATNEIRELNESLEIKVESRTQELREKNQQITESIEYAGKIQQSQLPTEEALASVFSKNFVVWRPKDVVGGDIYWLYRHKEGFLFAVIDCTGHGIPGALLTMSVSSSLDHIADQIGMRDPAKILAKLNSIMKNQLNQGVTSPYSDDGLEIGIVSYMHGSGELLYAGSKIKLIVRHLGEITEYKANKQGLGFKRTSGDQEYDLHRIPVDMETQFYMSTDGLIEQSGGLKGFGFGWKRFLGAIGDSGGFPEQIKTSLMDTYTRYKGANDQRDDILVAGFSINTGQSD